MKLRFVSAGAAQALVRRHAEREGLEVEGSFGAVGAMREKYLAGEPCDIVILMRKQLDELVAQGRVVPESLVDLGAVPTSIGVRGRPRARCVQCRFAAQGAPRLGRDLTSRPGQSDGRHPFPASARAPGHPKVRERIRNFPNGAAAMHAMGEASDLPHRLHAGHRDPCHAGCAPGGPAARRAGPRHRVFGCGERPGRRTPGGGTLSREAGRRARRGRGRGTLAVSSRPLAALLRLRLRCRRAARGGAGRSRAMRPRPPYPRRPSAGPQPPSRASSRCARCSQAAGRQPRLRLRGHRRRARDHQSPRGLQFALDP